MRKDKLSSILLLQLQTPSLFVRQTEVTFEVLGIVSELDVLPGVRHTSCYRRCPHIFGVNVKQKHPLQCTIDQRFVEAAQHPITTVSMSIYLHNVFAYYRGTSQPDGEREKQLEDNTTKALVNTLRFSGPSVAKCFLKWLGIASPRNTEFVLQKSTIGDEKIKSKSQRLLLGIVGSPLSANEGVCGRLPALPDGESRPDAWLHGDDFVVLVESKVGDGVLNSNQMACHRDKINPTELKVITWADVHRYFAALSPKLENEKAQWLVEQFTQYLEWTGMTEFVGFREEMFEFFVASERDQDTKRWVRGAMEGLADKVLDGPKGLKMLDSFYSHAHVGNIGKNDDHSWVAFGPDNFTTLTRQAHLTVAMYEDKLDVFVNVELLPAVDRLREKIKAGDGFRQLLTQLKPPFTTEVAERRLVQVQKYDHYRVAAVETGLYRQERYGIASPESQGLEFIETLLMSLKYPYLSVRRAIPRREVLTLSRSLGGAALVAAVQEILKDFHPVVDFINN